jgi:Pentapeptide repeats (8 copies)
MLERLQELRDYVRELDLYAKLRRAAPTLGVLAVLFLVVAGIWVVWRVPQWQVQHSLDTALRNDRAKQLELEDNFRKTIVQGLGGAIVLLGLYYSARTFGLSRQGHITDRFTKAIEQLGKLNGDQPSIEVRLGGIYALERIAIDSTRDHWTIMEVLTAYVRQNASLDPDRPYTDGEKPRTDIQAILTVLGRRKIGPNREHPGLRLDLSNSHLCGANLFSLNLQNAVMYKSNLQGASLQLANLQSASLQMANLQGANLNGANLQGASLTNANLQGASLYTTILQGADLQKANLQGAELEGAILQGAILADAKLEGASLGQTYLGSHYLRDRTLKQIKSARFWEMAHYNPDLREALDRLPDEETTPEFFT